jgi:hypothetical protein
MFVGHCSSVHLDEEYILSTSRIVCIQRRGFNSHWSIVLGDIQQIMDELSGETQIHLVVTLKPQKFRIGRGQQVLYLGLPDRCRAFLLMLQAVYPRLNTSLKHLSLREGGSGESQSLVHSAFPSGGSGSYALYNNSIHSTVGTGGEGHFPIIRRSKIQLLMDEESRQRMGAAQRLQEQQQHAQCCDCSCQAAGADDGVKERFPPRPADAVSMVDGAWGDGAQNELPEAPSFQMAHAQQQQQLPPPQNVPFPEQGRDNEREATDGSSPPPRPSHSSNKRKVFEPVHEDDWD